MPDLPGLPPALRGARLATVDVTFLGSASTGREYLSPLSAVGPPLSDTFDLLDIADLETICDEPTEPTYGMPRAWPLAGSTTMSRPVCSTPCGRTSATGPAPRW